MDTQETSFLPHFITEEVYVVNRNTSNIIEEIETKIESNHQLIIEGENQKEIAVIVNYPNKVPEQSKEFLFKILEAVKLNEDDIALINMGSLENKNNFGALKQFNFNTLIAFSTGLGEIFELTEERYSITSLNSKNILLCHELEDISNDVEKKKLLWKQLQILFKS